MRFHVRHILPVIADHYRNGGIQLCTKEDVEKALEVYNRINEILMNRDDWPGSEDNICIPVFGGVFSLPPRFESIKALRFNDEVLPILPLGFQYTQGGPGILSNENNLPAIQHLGSYFATMRDMPRCLPVFAVSECDESEATITIHGTDSTGRHRRETIPVNHAYPDRQPQCTTTAFASISASNKTVTNGHVELAAWDDSTGEILWLSSMEPSETSPTFTRYRAPECGHIAANVSLAYREIYDVEEVSLIQAREAYRLMTQAINAYDRDDVPAGSALKASAIKMLKERADKITRGQNQALPFNPPRHFKNPYNIRGH